MVTYNPPNTQDYTTFDRNDTFLSNTCYYVQVGDPPTGEWKFTTSITNGGYVIYNKYSQELKSTHHIFHCPKCDTRFTRFWGDNGFCSKCRRFFPPSSRAEKVSSEVGSLNTPTYTGVQKRGQRKPVGSEFPTKEHFSAHGYRKANLNRRLMHQPLIVEVIFD